MDGPQIRLLPDGKRLHMQHGPIDVIMEVSGPGALNAYRLAAGRFWTILDELVAELPALREPVQPRNRFKGVIAQSMHRAVMCHHPQFITPMAAVAGAVADALLSACVLADGVEKAWVNNGGDAAFHLGPGQHIIAAIAEVPGGAVTIGHDMVWRGIATSGRGGRSHSLGIADSVTVIARTAADADACATMIANAVNLPGHPSIRRQPANTLSPDSDLGDRLVTAGVGALDANEIRDALRHGAREAERMIAAGHAGAALLQLAGHIRFAGDPRHFSISNHALETEDA